MICLGDICTKESSNIMQKDLDGRDGEYPVFGASGWIKNIDFYKQDKPYIAVVKDGAGVGRVMLLPAKSSVIGTMQYIIPNEDINVAYLAYAMEHMNLSKYHTGATIPHIYFKDYCKELLPKHSIEEQMEIVRVLDKVSSLIALRKQQLAKLDELVKARFVELFGDPILNPKRFQTICGKNLFKISNGKAVPEEQRKSTGIPAYGGNGISWYTDESLFLNDTVIIGRVGFQSGNVHLANGPLWVTDNAMYISEFYTTEYDLTFLYYLMKFIDFTRYQDAGDLRKITQKPFMQMQFIYPSVELQHEYSFLIAQINQLKETIKKSLTQTETLKSLLMYKFFEGNMNKEK